MPLVFEKVAAFRAWRREQAGGRSLGFVPTLGGLHEGHLDLARRALADNERAAVSIFLNRTQFNRPEDFESYPAVLADDLAALEALGVDAVFVPSYAEMYPDDYRYQVVETEASLELEGAHRPGHFDGVLTVVMKLLQAAEATRAYFGEKDWQQLQLVQGMCRAFLLPVEIVACPTRREASGLAMSSRNRRLSHEGRERAAVFHQILNTAATPADAERQLAESGFAVEYVAEREGRRLGAVSLEGVRLIDNVALRPAGTVEGALGDDLE